TAKGEPRAQVALRSLDTLWFNTGTLCNLTCEHCYIESSPKNDRLVYLTAAEVAEYLDEIETGGLSTSLIGFIGGDAFMNSQPPACGRAGSGDTQRLCPAVRRARRRNRRRRCGGTYGVSGNGCGSRCSGDHRSVLGHSREIAGERHVRDVADDCEA